MTARTLSARVAASEANLLQHSHTGRAYAQFRKPLTARGYALLDQLFRTEPELWLRVYSYGDIPDVDFLQHLPSVRRMNLDHGPITNWEGLKFLSSDVQELEIGRYAKRVPLEAISHASTLRTLKLESVAPARDYPLIGRLSQLRHLRLRAAPLGGARATELFAKLTQLRTLELESCKLESLWCLVPLRKLQTLKIHGGNASLDGLPPLPALEELRVSGLPAKTLRPLLGAPRLERLDVLGLRGLGDVSAISKLTQLRRLSLAGVSALVKLPSLAHLDRLTAVNLHGLPLLHDLKRVAEVLPLTTLRVSDCPRIEARSFKPLVGHPRLKSLHLNLGRKAKNREVRALLEIPWSD